MADEIDMYSNDDRTARAAWCRLKGISMVEIEYTRPMSLSRWNFVPGDHWWVRVERFDANGDVEVDGMTVPAAYFRIVDRCGPEVSGG